MPDPVPPLTPEQISVFTRVQPGHSESADIVVEKNMAGAVAQIANNSSDILVDCIVQMNANSKHAKALVELVLANIDAVLNNETNNFKGVNLNRIKGLRNQADALIKGSRTSVKEFLLEDEKVYDTVLELSALPTHVEIENDDGTKSIVEIESLRSPDDSFDPKAVFRMDRVERLTSFGTAQTSDTEKKSSPDFGGIHKNDALNKKLPNHSRWGGSNAVSTPTRQAGPAKSSAPRKSHRMSPEELAKAQRLEAGWGALRELAESGKGTFTMHHYNELRDLDRRLS